MTLTPSLVLASDITGLSDTVTEWSGDTVEYHPTASEVRALEFASDRYDITALLIDGLEEQEDGSYLLRFVPWDVYQALEGDGIDRVPMLSDETALQRLVWVCGCAL